VTATGRWREGVITENRGLSGFRSGGQMHARAVLAWAYNPPRDSYLALSGRHAARAHTKLSASGYVEGRAVVAGDGL
jgi:hypothetical protein